MDCLFSKYGSPFPFINGMIRTNRFSEFVDEFAILENEKKSWEFYLHKIFDTSFEEFKQSIPAQKDEISEEHLETVVKDSKSILNNFIPEERGAKT